MSIPIAEDDPQQLDVEDLRETLHRVSAQVEAGRFTSSVSALTVEDCLDQFVERIEGASTPLRPSEMDRLDRLQSRVLAVVARLKAQPEDQARKPDPTKDVSPDAEA